MVTIRLTTTVDEEYFYMEKNEYGRDRRYVEGSWDKFKVRRGFLVLACSRLDHESLVQLYHEACALKQRRIDQAYVTWNMTEECMS